MIGTIIGSEDNGDRNYDLASDGLVWHSNEYIYLIWNMMGPSFEDSYAPKLKIGRFNPTGDGTYHEILTEKEMFGRSAVFINFKAHGYNY